MQQFSNDCDWYESEDDLIDAEQEGELVSFVHRTDDPIDRAQQDISPEEEPEGETVPTSYDEEPQADTISCIQTSTYGDRPSAQPGAVFSGPSSTPPPNTPLLPPHNTSFGGQPYMYIPGSITNLDEESHPYDFFVQIWGDSTFKYLAERTNIYAAQKGTASWTDVSEEEMKLLVGIQLATGIVRLPSMQDYWSTNPLVGIPGIVGGMTRDRFRAILSCLHVNDNSAAPARGTPGYDRLYKVWPLLEAIIKNTPASYILHQEVSVNEAMVLFKGRSTLKQYMPMKPTKQGFECWCLCDARNGLMYNVDVYQGAGEGSGTDRLGAAVVKRMLEPVYDRNHYVYVDNFLGAACGSPYIVFIWTSGV